MKTKTLTLAEQFKREGLKEGRREGRREGRQRWLHQGRQEGRNEGRNEGRTEGARELARQAVLRALELKHQDVPQGLVEALDHIEDLTRLKALLDRAILSASVEEFAAGL
jgi:flagellar biosynthesis/type III secretory pathway protein FliH